ncbi:hypothetical protein BCV70DRAFT_158479 [Testicularia cyperi]|uniref:Uncharacterized protein n=1 Tax=Testicularia cyperi TaxID=1882483 RepID=A0A317XUQ0_9BASI|nr:hypothetical protein BCV70DRAFT_158479 [Testicularia cyperi]
MVALALPRRQKDTGSGSNTPVSETTPALVGAIQSGKNSPDLADTPLVVEHHERQKPKRSSSFGRGLGGLASLTSGMAKAGDVMSLGKANKSGASTPQSPAPVSPSEGLSAASSILATGAAVPINSMGPPSTPDPSHLTQFSLKLSDLVNKAFVPCTAGAAAPGSTTGSVAANVAAAAKGATSLTVGGNSSSSTYAGIPKINHITYEGKHLPDKAKIIEIAQTVVGELRYAEAVDAYLLRAVSRQILKALTLFAARIDSLLVSPTKDSGALKVPATPKEGLHLPAAMEFNIGLITLEWIVEDSLERCIEGDRDARGDLIPDENGQVYDGMPHFVSEILTPVRKKMEGTILHIIQPLLTQTKLSIVRCMSAAVPTPFMSPVSLSPIPTPGSASAATGTTAASAAAVSGVPSENGAISPSAHVPGNVSPPQRTLADAGLAAALGSSSTWLRELDGRLEGARRLLLPRIEERCGQDGEGWFISVAIHIIWKGLLILTSRSVALPGGNNTVETVLGSNAASASAFDRLMGEVNQKRSPSPAQLTQALKAVGVGSTRAKNRDTLDSLAASGRQTPQPHHASCDSLASITPFSLVSNRLCAHQLAELQAFEKLMLRFCDGFLRKPGTQSKKAGKGQKRSRFALFASSATPSSAGFDLSAYDPDEEDELARAALAEAMHALKSTIIVLQTMERDPAAICAGLEQLKSLPDGDGAPHSDADGAPQTAALAGEAAQALDAIPNLLLLQVLYNRLPLGPGRMELPNPPALFGYTWSDYEKAIAGFAGGEQWAQAAALRYKPEIEKAWRSVAARKADRLASLEERCAKAGGRASRSVSASSRNGSALAQSNSRDSDDGDEDLDEEANDAMSQSVPALKKPNSRESEIPAQGSTRGRPSPTQSPRRSVTLGLTPNGSATAATTAPAHAPAPAAANPPRFWRRSSSNARSGFHLSFSGLRSHSPRTTPTNEYGLSEPVASPSAASSTAADPMNGAPSAVSAPAPAGTPLPAAANPTTANPGSASPPRDVSSSNMDPSSSNDLSERVRIELQAKLEHRCLGMFAKATAYAARGQIHFDLR